MTSHAVGTRGVRRWIYLWDLLRESVARDMKLRYRRSIFGVAWTLLNPLAELLVLLFIFRVVLPLNIPNYASFLFTGLLVYGWFQSSLYLATGAIVNNRELIRRPGFPAAILPVVSVGSNLVHFLLALPVLFVLLVVNGIALTGALFALPLVIALQFTLTLSLAYVLATVHVWFRDTQYVLRVLLQLLFYLTPIFYETTRIPARYQRLYHLNPMVSVVEAYRAILVHGTFPDFGALAVLGLGSAGLLVAGLTIFTQARHRFVDEL